MTTEPLSEMLRLLGPQSVLTGMLCASGAWSVDFAPQPTIKFWGIVEGNCHVSMVDGTTLPLQAGDVLLILQPTSMTLTTDWNATPVSVDQLLSRAADGICRIGEGDDFVLIGGTVTLDARARSLLFDALPAFIHVNGNADQAGPLRWILDQLMQERADRLPGAGAASAQLVQLMFIYILRAHLKQDGDVAPGWLRLASDRRFASMLALVHSQPGKDWRLSELANASGMSRATFALHFRTVAGVGPVGYLAQWRMRLAEQELRKGGISIAKLAESLGYSSESAFSHAFKRVTGYPPKSVRSRAMDSRPHRPALELMLPPEPDVDAFNDEDS
ncbi:AraC family transcriptional regulator [Pandoraea sp. NPDC087047]|uniref:AraC family transcriptional regulator n=1 Tax=Pandoraea sp. NPDC087047 TaxID=3364390 RepID=UPI0038112102